MKAHAKGNTLSRHAVWALLILLLTGIALVTAGAPSTIFAQDDGRFVTLSFFGVGVYPQAVLPDGTQVPSLTGVGGRAERAAVAIRGGAGVTFPRVSRLTQGAWIEIVAWSGWDADRVCSPVLEDDLDMWVQVQFQGSRRGWIARCVLTIVGDVSALPIISASGETIFQR